MSITALLLNYEVSYDNGSIGNMKTLKFMKVKSIDLFVIHHKLMDYLSRYWRTGGTVGSINRLCYRILCKVSYEQIISVNLGAKDVCIPIFHVFFSTCDI